MANKNSPPELEENYRASKLLVMVMLDEIERLKQRITQKERSEIRKFILECGKILVIPKEEDL